MSRTFDASNRALYLLYLLNSVAQLSNEDSACIFPEVSRGPATEAHFEACADGSGGLNEIPRRSGIPTEKVVSSLTYYRVAYDLLTLDSDDRVTLNRRKIQRTSQLGNIKGLIVVNSSGGYPSIQEAIDNAATKGGGTGFWCLQGGVS